MLFGRRYSKEERVIAQQEKKRAEELATAEIAEEREDSTKEVNQLEAEAKTNQSDKSLQNVGQKAKGAKGLNQKNGGYEKKGRKRYKHERQGSGFFG